jgi:hypothetical protein
MEYILCLLLLSIITCTILINFAPLSLNNKMRIFLGGFGESLNTN